MKYGSLWSISMYNQSKSPVYTRMPYKKWKKPFKSTEGYFEKFHKADKQMIAF